MRPTPSETLAEVVRILRDTVQPAVADAHAGAQLRQAIAVLRALDAEDAVQAVRAHTAQLQPVLDACTTWVRADDARSSLAGTLDRAAALAPEPSGFAATNRRHEAARHELASFIDALAAWRATHGTTDSEGLLRLIGVALARDAMPTTGP